ncbi:gluconolactonase [Nitrospira sp.]|nr:gluconolactonase [Nitrospira sp.]
MNRTRVALLVTPLASVLLQIAGALATMTPITAPITITSLEPRFDRLVPRDAKLEKIAEGFTWVEGPVWHKQGAYLLFSDIPANRIYKWTRREGLSVFLEHSGYSGSRPFAGREPGSNGLTFDAAGRLVLCRHGDRQIGRLEADGRITVLADRYEDYRLNSPNDLVFKSNGDLYFTDPPFGLPKFFDEPDKAPVQGVYRLSPNGALRLLISDLTLPNGIAFSPDERTLYLSDDDPDRLAWLAYDVQEDGTLSNGRVLLDATHWRHQSSGPDGLKVDRDGNIFATRPGGISVIAPDGTLLGTIEIGQPTSNVAWGEDGQTLFITANDSVYRLRVTTAGAHY